MEETTRVYQYGAVLINPGKGRPTFATDAFPKAGVDELFRRNRLWNELVEIHNETGKRLDEARRAANAAYREVAGKLDAIEDEIKEAYSRKRAAREKAGTRDASHPLIKEANREIKRLEAEGKNLREEAKPHRKEADKLIDKKALTKAFSERVKAAQRVENTGGLNGQTANETARYFREARSRTFDNPGSRLRFHPCDGTGFLFYRFRRPGRDVTKDGVTFDEIARGEIVAAETFRLARRKRVRRGKGGKRSYDVYRLRLKVAGGARKASKVYAEFDLHLHRPIPEGAQINNAKLLRRRAGDRFRHLVSFSVRVPAAAPAGSSPPHAIGVDIGFKMRHGEYRVATVAVEEDTGWKFKHLTLPEKYADRLYRVEEIQSLLDESARELGDFIKPRLKGCEAASDKAHSMHKLVFCRIVRAPANVTMSFELAYKLGGKIRGEPGSLPAEVEERTLIWRERWRKLYREMHSLRGKTLAWRREIYRVFAAELVALGKPIAIEDIDLRKFAEACDADSDLSNQARSQRFDVAPSEFLGALRNCAAREGVPLVEVDPAYTSKTCSECGCLNRELDREVEWICADCGARHDRDENAAKNIARAAVKKTEA